MAEALLSALTQALAAWTILAFCDAAVRAASTRDAASGVSPDWYDVASSRDGVRRPDGGPRAR